jgi:hypothetical protein
MSLEKEPQESLKALALRSLRLYYGSFKAHLRLYERLHRSLKDVLDAPHSTRTKNDKKDASTERPALKRGKRKATHTHTHTHTHTNTHTHTHTRTAAQEEGGATLKAVKEALTLERLSLNRAPIEP